MQHNKSNRWLVLINVLSLTCKKRQGIYTSRLAVFFGVAMLLCSDTLRAQRSVNLGIDLAAGTRSFPLNGRFGNGVSAEYQETLTPRSGLRLYVGFVSFQQKFPNVNAMTVADSMRVIGIRGYDLSLLPLRVGYEYHPASNSPFVYGETGLSHVFTRYHNPTVPRNVFTLAIGAGYKRDVSNNSFLQLSVSYNYNDLKQFGKRNYFGFRLAYGWTKYKSHQKAIAD